MINTPAFYILPYGYVPTGASDVIPSADPIGDCILAAAPGAGLQLAPGLFPPIKKNLSGKVGIHLCGWRDPSGSLQSTISPDYLVGSTDTICLGQGTARFLLEDLLLPCDDRAGVKTVAGVGPQHSLLRCRIYGAGSPHVQDWKNEAKWGVHTYDAAGWSEVDVWKWSIAGEHGDYHHNLQGNHAYQGGGVGNLSGCDLFYANRQNEGAEGKGDVVVQDRYVEDVCVGQGGSAWSFRGGMPKSRVTFKRVTGRLGCNPALATPFNENICGLAVVDEADETTPGAGDAAWPGGTAELNFDDCDLEVGTVWPGRTGMIRPVLDVRVVGLFTWLGGRMRVTRPPGAYPLGLNIEPTVGKVAIGDRPEWTGWVQYHGTRYRSLELFLSAHPECAA